MHCDVLYTLIFSSLARAGHSTSFYLLTIARPLYEQVLLYLRTECSSLAG